MAISRLGCGGQYEQIQATPGLDTRHAVRITNLAEGTVYSFTVRATDQNQNSSLSESGTFATAGVALENLPRQLIVPVGYRRLLQPVSPDPRDSTFTFSSSAPAIVSVDRRGALLAASPGQARITVTANESGSTASFVVGVFTPPDPNFRRYRGFFGLLGILLLQDGESGIIDPCFVATAASGTPLAANIDILRDFRDEWLLTNAPGTMFVDAY